MKPTIEQLEKMLDSPDCPIELLPNGEIIARGESFEWMKKWLIAYQEANGDIDVDKIINWILKQPMQAG